MRDEDIAAGIVAGDPDQLGAAYDRYAPALYAYCQSRLNDPVRAADVVKDTFVVAAAKLSALRDQSRLRAWLYAVARNECRHRLDGQDVAHVRDDAAVMGDETMDFGTALEQAERRELVRSALAGLSPADQEIVELSLRHDLHGGDLADVLGVQPGQAEALDSAATQLFETALGALLMARSGEGSCPQLSEILAGWNQELTEDVSNQVRQHVSSCPICQDARRHQVDPVAALRVLPPAVLPGSLRYELLQLLTDQSPEASQYCVAVATRAEPFNRWGFPVPLDSPAAGKSPARLLPVAGVLAVVLLVLGGGAALAAHELHHSAGPPLPAATSAAPSSHPATAKPGGKQAKHPHTRSNAAAGSSPSAPAAARKSATPAKSAKASKSATPKPSKTKHTTAPTTSPPTTHPPTTSPPTTHPPTTSPPTTSPPTTSPPTPSSPATGGAASRLLSSFVSLLAAL